MADTSIQNKPIDFDASLAPTASKVDKFRNLTEKYWYSS
jgi:hypothetical protein